MNAIRAVVGVVGGLAITGGFFVYFDRSTPPSVAATGMPAVPIPVTVPQVPSPPSSADLLRIRAQYLSDRDKVRKANPKTEADVTKLIGRPPDNVMQLPSMTMVMWYYEDKADGTRDVLQISTNPSGAITLMNL